MAPISVASRLEANSFWNSRSIPHRFSWLCLLGLLLQPPLQAAGVAFHPVVPPKADAGILLMNELQCSACHDAGSTPGLEERLGRLHAPALGKEGIHLTPQWITRWLSDPQSSKPGTAMPHVLAQVPAAQRQEAVEALTHFLSSNLPDPAQASRIVDQGMIQQGRTLFHKVGCVACHAPDQAPEGMTSAELQAVQSKSIPFGDLARKYTLGDLAAYLQNPFKYHPTGRMPSLNLSSSEAFTLGGYLLRAQTNSPASRRPSLIQGLQYEYFEGNFGGNADFANQTPVATGQVPAPTLEIRKRNAQFGIRFFGQIQIPKNGDYRFWTTSDDGSRLYIDGKQVVNNDGERPAATKNGKVTLAAGLHDIEIRYTQGGGEWVLTVQWAGPDMPRAELNSEYLRCNGSPMAPLDAYEFTVDPAKAARGKALYAELNCAACHQGGTASQSVAIRKSKPMAEVAKNPQGGCLSETPNSPAPLFTLDPKQRKLLQSTLADIGKHTAPMTGDEKIQYTLASLQCFACHQRDGVGGVAAGQRDGWFTVQGEADLGDEGRIPPHLTGVGRKLRPEWLKKVLAQGVKSRPYMATRMPVFAAAHTSPLAEVISRTDTTQASAAVVEPAVTERDAKWGWKLVGREGLGCVNCHTFTKYGSMGIPALSLESMHERLNWEWFSRYLPDPAALRPGTRMPSFWPDGKAVNTDILGGDTAAQVRAIWAYLAGGAKAEVPSGLVRGKKELIPDQEPVIYRNFIEGAGARAIGVGYPERVHLAWDANQMRPALFWQGSFIDMARHSTDRGTGFEGPLGDHIIKMPEGPAVAELSSPQETWPAKGGKDAGYHFKGYELDDKRRPSFRYTMGGVEIVEKFIPSKRDPDLALTRVLEVKGGNTSNVYARVAKGSLAAQADGSYLINGQYRIQFPHGIQATVVENELRVAFPTSGSSTGTIQFEMIW